MITERVSIFVAQPLSGRPTNKELFIPLRIALPSAREVKSTNIYSRFLNGPNLWTLPPVNRRLSPSGILFGLGSCTECSPNRLSDRSGDDNITLSRLIPAQRSPWVWGRPSYCHFADVRTILTYAKSFLMRTEEGKCEKG